MLSVYDWSDAAGAETHVKGRKEKVRKAKKKKELIFRNLTHIFSENYSLHLYTLLLTIDMCIYINPLYLIFIMSTVSHALIPRGNCIQNMNVEKITSLVRGDLHIFSVISYTVCLWTYHCFNPKKKGDKLPPRLTWFSSLFNFPENIFATRMFLFAAYFNVVTWLSRLSSFSPPIRGQEEVSSYVWQSDSFKTETKRYQKWRSQRIGKLC